MEGEGWLVLGRDIGKRASPQGGKGQPVARRSDDNDGELSGGEYGGDMYGVGEHVRLGNRSAKVRGEPVAALARTKDTGVNDERGPRNKCTWGKMNGRCPEGGILRGEGLSSRRTRKVNMRTTSPKGGSGYSRGSTSCGPVSMSASSRAGWHNEKRSLVDVRKTRYAHGIPFQRFKRENTGGKTHRHRPHLKGRWWQGTGQLGTGSSTCEQYAPGVRVLAMLKSKYQSHRKDVIGGTIKAWPSP